MITLHRNTKDPEADQIEERFNDLVLSYKSVISDENSDSDTLPKIVDGKNTISGKDQIENWLRELEEELKWQRSISGDGCFIDPKTGEIC